MPLRIFWLILFFVLALAPVTSTAQLVATPDPLDFGDVILTEIKDDQLILESRFSAPILISNFFVTQGNARDNEFEILSPALRTFQMVQGEKRNIIFRFAPDFEGLRTKRLLVQTSVGDFTFELQGTGKLTNPILTLSATDLNFGKVSITGQKQLIVTITNIAEDEAKISDLNIANFSGVEHFKALPDDITESFPIILAQGESTKLRVTFDGASPIGFKTGLINLVGSVGGQTTITLSGEVVEADLLIQPDPLDFGNVPIGVPLIRVVTFTAEGEEPIQIDYLNDLQPPFSYVNPPSVPFSIIPGTPYELEVQIIANASGPMTSQIQLISEDFSGSNFKSLDIFANGLTPVRIQGSDDFTFYCGSKKPIRRSVGLRNDAPSAISIEGFTAPAGVSFVSGLPFQVAGNSAASIEFDFDPNASSLPRELQFEYLNASSVLVRDTIIVTPILANVQLKQAAVQDNIVDVTSSFDFTSFEVSTLDVALTIERPDLFSLVVDSIKLNSDVISGATTNLRETAIGSYVLEIRSSAPFIFDPLIPISQQPLFSYRPRAFTANELVSQVAVDIINDDLCATTPGDSITLQASEYCGDDLVRASLAGQPISGISIFPNPGSVNPTLSLHSAVNGTLELLIVTMNGVEVGRSQTSILAGHTTLLIPTNGLPEGGYMLVITSRDPGFTSQIKFVIER